MNRKLLLTRRLGLAVSAAAAVFTGAAVADDTEIFRAEYANANVRPKVLIIFDNSGSMAETITIPKPDFDPDTNYPNVGNIRSDRLYWSTDGTAPSASSSNYISAGSNRCASSYAALGSTGFYTDQFGTWRASNSNSWDRTMSSSVKTPLHVDCRDDIENSNSGNGTASGSPGNGYYPRASSQPYSTTRDTSVGAGRRPWTTYTLFTSNYMNWYRSTTLTTQTVSKLSVAKSVITNIVNSNPGIDFGLAVFNRNTSSTTNGGRVVRALVSNMTSSQRSSLVSTISGLSAQTNTPLCETTYEAYRYLTGQSVLYGLQKSSDDSPSRDTSAETSSQVYRTPIGDCQNTYIILMTDGLPTQDSDANSRIESLTGRTCGTYEHDANEGNRKNCLPEIAEHMAQNDLDNNPSNGIQRGITYTIGFTVDQQLLRDTARRGGGEYYTANDTAELTSAFQGAITSILSQTSAFTSPAVAVNNATRTESRDEIYFAMFKPTEGTDWPGNLKKLKGVVENGVLVLKDSVNAQAIDASTNWIRASAKTFWGDGTADGGDVDRGGVGARLLARLTPGTTPTDGRVIKTNVTTTSSGGAVESLVDFTSSVLTASALGFSSADDLFDFFGVSDQNELNDVIAWGRGWTDRSRTAKREWILGDIMHSRPLVLDYGPTSSPNLRIVVGTNAGFLHMFDNSSGDENWAFIPRQLLPILKPRKTDRTGAANVYGVDSPIAVYRYDANNDGVISSGGNDRMIIYFGLRRGGHAYYALDVTNPASPSILWQIDGEAVAGSSPLSELGQTWSMPVVTRIPGRSNPVLIFGAGYDPGYDDANLWARATTAQEGRGVFIVDALTGALVWSATPATTAGSNLQVSAMTHPIPARVTVVDSNADGLTDRIYAPDLGGNVWRIDLPSATTSDWRVTRLASLAGTSHADDRRFFNAIDVVRTSVGSVYFDALLLGSGDRTNPNAVNNSDRFYMLRDRQVTPITTAPPTSGECADTNSPKYRDVRCTWPITDSGLYDVTANLVQDGTSSQVSTAVAALRPAENPRSDPSYGWRLSLETSGEKSLSQALTVAGRVMFTTFSPAASGTVSDSTCVPALGTGRLYVVGLQDARSVLDLSLLNGTTMAKADRVRVFNSLIPDTPTMFHAKDGSIHGILPDGETLRLPAHLQRVRTYWYEQER